jgi:hypothetical protein
MRNKSKAKVEVNLRKIKVGFECCICEEIAGSGYMLSIGIVKEGNTLSLVLLNFCKKCYRKHLGITKAK